jgi:4-amino-4-deoxy-L-arabinose transferase-like glycosyltransferase
MASRVNKNGWIIAGIVGFAFLLRLVFIFQWQETPYGGLPYLDALMCDEWAQRLLQGHLFSERAFYQSPLFPYVLALLYTLTGHDVLNVAFFNAVLGAASCGLLAYAAGRAFGVRALMLTGVLAALYAPLIFYTGPVLKEALGFFLFAAYLVVVLLALETNQRRYYISAGFLLGLAILTRGNAVFLLIALPLLAFVQKKPKFLRGCSFYVLGAFLVLVPVTLHNAYVSHDFVPITYSNGFNFYIGNREGTNGANNYPSDIHTNDKEELSTTKIAETALGHTLKPSEVSAYWFNKGLHFIVHDPASAFGLWLHKAVLFFSNQEFFDNYNSDFFRQEMHSFLHWPFFPGFALVLGLSAFAFFAAEKEQRRAMQPFLLLAALYIASVLPFYVTDRYRLPVVVFLLPLAGAAVLSVASSTRVNIAAIIALLLHTGSMLYPPKDPRYTMAGWLGLGSAQLKRGEDAAAVTSLSRAIEIAPKTVETYWYVEAAKAADRTSQHDKALTFIEAARHVHPEDEAQIRAHYGTDSK